METSVPIQNNHYHITIDKQPPSKSFLGVEYDTLTLLSGVFVPLLAFLFGFLFSVLRDRFREKTSIRITADSFFLWIGKSVNSAGLLLKEIEEKKQEAENLDSFQISKPAFINLHLNRLATSDRLLYKAFVNLKKGDVEENFADYSKLLVNLDFLDDFQKMFLQNSQYIVDDFQKMFDKWNDTIYQLHNAKHILVGRRSEAKNKEIILINDCFNYWYENEEKGLSRTERFLKNLEPPLQSFYSKNPADDELANLLSITIRTRTLYQQFLLEKERVLQMYSRFYTQLDETLSEINTLAKKIQSKENKVFYI